MAPTDSDLLKAIDGKLAALLVLRIDEYLRATGIARPKPRSVDRMLADSGLPVADIAKLLGKTERAVYLMLKPTKIGVGGQEKADGSV